MAVKKCFKLHKQFLTEVERCVSLDRDGERVIASLANVSERLPLLSATADPANSQPAIGVLAHCHGARSLLLLKHFAALEKASNFLADIARDFQDSVRRLPGIVAEFVELVDGVAVAESAASDVCLLHGMMEWMDTVVRMFQQEALRKKLLVAAPLEYSQPKSIADLHQRWPAHSAHGCVDQAYLSTGMAAPPPLPAPTPVAQPASDTATSTTSKKKKAKNKKTK